MLQKHLKFSNIILTSTMFKQEETNKEKNLFEHKEDEEDDGNDSDVQKEVVGDWKLVDLPILPQVTGEEQQEELAKFKTKAYRFHDKQWKERGKGELRFLKHKVSGLIRILTRAETTHKCIMNHYTISKDQVFGKLEQLNTSNNTWTWGAQDISDEVLKTEKFCARFVSKEEFERFGAIFRESCEANTKIMSEKKTVENKEENAGENKEQKKE